MGAGTLWGLIEERVDATPDALLAVDEEMSTITFAELAIEAERAAAGLAVYGVGEHTVVSWQMPTWIESFVLVAALIVGGGMGWGIDWLAGHFGFRTKPAFLILFFVLGAAAAPPTGVTV